MASLAGMLKEQGFDVRGSDQNVYPPMSEELARQQIPCFSGYHEKNLEWKPDVVVIGNAISRGNPEVEKVLDEGIRYASLPEMVRECFLRGHHSIVVAGTHGKTTTTSLLAWIFECAGKKPNFLIGGIAQNFGRSFQLSSSDPFILEGDEYDTVFYDKGPKFLHYLPRTVLINNIEFDHADIYANLEAVRLSFQRLVNIIPRNGLLVANASDPTVVDVSKAAFCRVQYFQLGQSALSGRVASSRPVFWADKVSILAEGTSFALMLGQQLVGELFVPLFGDFNASNAVAAAVVALQHGISIEAVREALRTFLSVRRRMEVRGEAQGITVIDDFAHHPTAIRETLRGVKARFPGRRIWAVVEPRSATMRRSVYQEDLVEALKQADVSVIADLFSPEKVPVDQRLSPGDVVAALTKLGHSAHFIKSAEEIVSFYLPVARRGDVFVVFSNGAFENIHERLLSKLRSNAAPIE